MASDIPYMFAVVPLFAAMGMGALLVLSDHLENPGIDPDTVTLARLEQVCTDELEKALNGLFAKKAQISGEAQTFILPKECKAVMEAVKAKKKPAAAPTLPLKSPF